MAALTNTITAADIAKSQDIEMLTNFNGELNRLTEILGLFDPEIVAAGTAMFQYTVTGSLNTSPVAEGDELPLSKYTVTPTQLDPITIKPYRKLTTAQAILKGGYENAIAKTDKKRAAYHNSYSDHKWGAMETYHLTVDSSVLGTEGTAALIRQFLELQKEI